MCCVRRLQQGRGWGWFCLLLTTTSCQCGEPKPGVKTPHPECSTGTVLGRGGRLRTMAGSCLSQPLHRCGGKRGRVRPAQNSRISIGREDATIRHVCLVLSTAQWGKPQDLITTRCNVDVSRGAASNLTTRSQCGELKPGVGSSGHARSTGTREGWSTTDHGRFMLEPAITRHH